MWSKFSSAITGSTNKPPRDLSHSQEHSRSNSRTRSDSQPEVLAGVFEQHPNLSVFHPSGLDQHGEEDYDDSGPMSPLSPSGAPNSSAAVELLLASPPGSLSKNGGKGLLKRMSRSQNGSKVDGDGSVRDSISPIRLGMPAFVKKGKSHLNLVMNDSDSSISRGPESANDGGRPSLDSIPPTPQESKFGGSVRSILRDRNTPGKGASVRFFSRDASKASSPDVSTAPSEPGTPPLMERFESVASGLPSPEALQSSSVSRARYRPRPSLDGLFAGERSPSPGPQPTMSTPAPPSTRTAAPGFGPGLAPVIPPPDLSNIFELSHSEFPTIAPGSMTPLQDNAVETSEEESNADVRFTSASPFPGGRQEPTVFHSVENRQKPSPTGNDRSLSFSFGQNVFHAAPSTKRTVVSAPSDLDISKLMSSTASQSDLGHGRSHSRNRSMSDTIFHSYPTNTPTEGDKTPEADIHDIATSALVVYSTPSADRPILPPIDTNNVPDPFSTHATTYYTPGAGIPPTPPRPTASTQQHSRKASKEENELWNLKTQLTLQQELCAQYEIDLGARNELVEVLSTKLDTIDKENEKRKQMARGWKKKVAELERMCRHLEDEVERSREESLDRSVMDEASGEALRQLQTRIGQLERERERGVEEVHEEVMRLRDEAEEREREVERLKEELLRKEEGERALKEGIRNAQMHFAEMSDDDLLAEGGDIKAAARMSMMSIGPWEQERAILFKATEDLRAEKRALEEELDGTREAGLAKDEEMRILRAELEAQWQHTEKAGDSMTELKKEKTTLQNELVALEQRMERMEIEWNESQTKRGELELELQETLAEHEENVKQYQLLEEELRTEQEHADDVARTLQDREDRIANLQQELKFANDNVTRLEQHLKQRDDEVEDLAHKIVAREDEIYEIQEELTSFRRTQSHETDSQQRTLAELTKREKGAREQLEVAVRERAEVQVQASTFGDRVKGLEGEMERLRKQITDLKMESADKEMKIVQMKRENGKLGEDNEGLNIALSSKQQELELIKRKMAVKGTAGATPAPSRVTANRRDSAVFNTPATVSRPSSRLSDRGTSLKDPTAGAPSSFRAPSRSPETANTTIKASTLGKSARTNTTSASSSTLTAARSGRASVEPPSKRMSTIGAPTSVAQRRVATTATSRLGAKPATPSTVKRASSVGADAKTSGTKPSRSGLPASRGMASAVVTESEAETETETEPESELEKENEEPTMRLRVPVLA